MEMLIDTITGDYNGTRTDGLANAVYIRLTTPLGSWWADKTVGSLLHTLQREKDRSRVYTLAKQYSEQALQPLIDDGRAESIRVSAEKYQNRSGWLLLLIHVVSAAGHAETFKHPVRVI
ncbi:hypothetical protein BM640_001258 [Shigella sonnei]|nr:hypothetical protein [Shigella sonnei]EFZ0655791.1 hypothetical protein [Shigella sonnei]EFZ2872834.1 hypothetical protein [Shigella sonnei]EFZ3697898.1 hypothetical protein [Shigella sonnei]EFZ7274872.1 hypothetical protein [Shigella sonnei]